MKIEDFNMYLNYLSHILYDILNNIELEGQGILDKKEKLLIYVLGIPLKSLVKTVSFILSELHSLSIQISGLSQDLH